LSRVTEDAQDDDQHTLPPGPTEPACGRAPLVEAITTFLAHERGPAVSEIRESLELAIDEAGPDALSFLGRRLASAGTDWRYYPRDPLVRRIHHVLADLVLEQDPVLLGMEHLAAIADKPEREKPAAHVYS
jgi:hypothetical protein